MEDLRQFQEFRDFEARSRKPRRGLTLQLGTNQGRDRDGATPLETIESAAAELRTVLADQLLERLRGESPGFFEDVVLDVLLAMGYGGSRQEVGERLGGSGDGGVDGVIREDSLGLDVIYLQAKRWSEDHPVRRPDVQAFIGALQGVRADKGYAAGIQTRIVLIDGRELSDLMIEYGVGVSVARTFDLKRLDEDYFDSDLAEA